MLAAGALVIDRRCREPAVIRHVERVPETRDLFGSPVPAHERFVVQFPDGRWQNNRVASELTPLG